MRIVCLLAGMALLTFQLVQALADDPSTSPVPPEIQKPLDQTTSGAISGVDASTRVLRLSGAFANKIFKVSPEAKIIISTVPEAKLDDLKVGDQVEINYQEKDGLFLVSRITKVEAIAPPVTK